MQHTRLAELATKRTITRAGHAEMKNMPAGPGLHDARTITQAYRSRKHPGYRQIWNQLSLGSLREVGIRSWPSLLAISQASATLCGTVSCRCRSWGNGEN